MTSPPGYPPPGDQYGQPSGGPQQPAGGPQPPGWPPQQPPRAPYQPPASGAPHQLPTSGAPDQPSTSGAAPYQPHPYGSPYQPPGAQYPRPAPPYEATVPGDQTTQPGFPPPPPAPTARRRRQGPLIIGIVLAAVLVLCAGGGTAAYLLLTNLDGKGQATPAEAVDGFLTAVYKNKSVDQASRYVCSTARKTADLEKKINELKAYEQQYRTPRYSWSTPTVESQTRESAKLTVPVTFTSADDRVAEQKLRITVINDNGWWVCDVQTYV